MTFTSSERVTSEACECSHTSHAGLAGSRGRTQACSVLTPAFPAGCCRGMSSAWTEGNWGWAVCVCVCQRLKLEAACLSHTVDPYFLFSLSCVYFPERKRKEEEEKGWLQPPPQLWNVCDHSCFCGFCGMLQPSTVAEICEECRMKREAAGDESFSASPAAPVSST